MGTIAVTGSASGIGFAVADPARRRRAPGDRHRRRRRRRHRGSRHPRRPRRGDRRGGPQADGRLDGLVTAAGIGGSASTQGGRLIAVTTSARCGSSPACSPCWPRPARPASSASGRIRPPSSPTGRPTWPRPAWPTTRTRPFELAESVLSIFAYPAGRPRSRGTCAPREQAGVDRGRHPAQRRFPGADRDGDDTGPAGRSPDRRGDRQLPGPDRARRAGPTRSPTSSLSCWARRCSAARSWSPTGAPRRCCARPTGRRPGG